MPSKSVERRLAAQGVETREEWRVLWRDQYGNVCEHDCWDLEIVSASLDSLWRQSLKPKWARAEVRTVTVGPWRKVEEE
jgi:hypothetical protein